MTQTTIHFRPLGLLTVTAAATLTGCGTATVTAVLGGNESTTESALQVTLLEAADGLPEVADFQQGIPADRRLNVRFTGAMQAGRLLDFVRLETPVDTSIDSCEDLPGAAYRPVAGVELSQQGPGATSFDVVLSREVFGDVRRIPLHAGRWYRLRVDRGAPAQNGQLTESAITVHFRVSTLRPEEPSFLGETLPEGAAVLPDGEVLVTFESASGDRPFSLQSVEGGGFSNLLDIGRRRFADPVDGFPPSAFSRSSYRQSNSIGLVTSRSGRAYRLVYEPKIGLDDTRHPVSFFVGTLDRLEGNANEQWLPRPYRDSNQPGRREDFGAFEGTDAGWRDLRSHVFGGGSIGAWLDAGPVPIVHSWFPEVVPIGDRPDADDGPERALCVWSQVAALDRSPLDPGTGSALLVSQPTADNPSYDSMRETLQRSQIVAKVYGTSGYRWSPQQTLSTGLARPYRSDAFTLPGEEDGETLILWYESSRPIPMSTSVVAGRRADEGFDADLTPVSGGPWWPTQFGEEDLVLVRARNGPGAVNFGPPTPFEVGTGSSIEPRSLVRPLRVERIGGTNRIVVVGLDPLHDDENEAPPLVAQIVTLPTESSAGAATAPFRTRPAGDSITMPARWSERARAGTFFFGPITPTRFMLVQQGATAPTAVQSPILIACVLDTDPLVSGTPYWTPWERLTNGEFNLDYFNTLGAPVTATGGMVEHWEFTEAAATQDEDGNLSLLVQQSFDLNGDGRVETSGLERNLGLTSFFYFDAKKHGLGTSAPIAPGWAGRAWSPPMDLIDRNTNTLVFTASAVLTASDDAGRMFSVPRLTDPLAPPSTGYTAAGLAIRLGATTPMDEVGCMGQAP